MKDKRKLYNYPDDEIEEDFLEWWAGYIDSCWVKLDEDAKWWKNLGLKRLLMK